MSDVSAAPDAADAEARLLARRRSLLEIGRFAALTAPAMLVLLAPGTAGASSNDDGADAHYNEHTHRHSNA